MAGHEDAIRKGFHAMSTTPSRRRREGREAYYRGGDPGTSNPYVDCGYAADWLRGWYEGERDDLVAQQQNEQVAAEEEAKLDEFVRLYQLARERGLI